MLTFTSDLERPPQRPPHHTCYHSGSLRCWCFHDNYRGFVHIDRDQDEMATYILVCNILGQLGCYGFDRIRHASARYKCCTGSLFRRRLWYRITIRRWRVDFRRPDRGLGLLVGGLLPEYVVPGAQTRRSHAVHHWESRVYSMLHAGCLCTLRKPLYSPIWSHWFYFFRWCDGHRTGNRLL